MRVNKKIFIARKRARLIEPDTDSDFDSGRGSLLTNKEAPYKIALKKLRESREKRMSTSSFASSSSSVLKKSIDESYVFI